MSGFWAFCIDQNSIITDQDSIITDQDSIEIKQKTDTLIPNYPVLLPVKQRQYLREDGCYGYEGYAKRALKKTLQMKPDLKNSLLQEYLKSKA